MKSTILFSCGSFLVIVCSVVGACQDGWTSHGRRCYIYLREPYNWFDAQEACHWIGGTLVEIESASENQFVEDFAHSHGAPQVWIGLNDLAEEGVFVWTSTRAHAEYFAWVAGEPTDSGTGEDCVLLRYRSGWLDWDCENGHLPFVCATAGHEVDPSIG